MTDSLTPRYNSDMGAIFNAYAPETEIVPMYTVPSECKIPKNPAKKCSLMKNEFTGNTVPCWLTAECPKGFKKILINRDGSKLRIRRDETGNFLRYERIKEEQK